MGDLALEQPNHLHDFLSLECWVLTCVHGVQALQQQMADEGIEADVVSHMLGIEAAMEAWDKAGRPEAALTQAEQLFQQSQVIKMKPLFKTNDPRFVVDYLRTQPRMFLLLHTTFTTNGLTGRGRGTGHVYGGSWLSA